MKKTEKLYNGITNISEDLIEEAQAAKPQQRLSVRMRWMAAAACVCLAVTGMFVFFSYREGEHKVQQWSSGFKAKDYFKYSDGDSESAITEDKTDMVCPYAESRYFSDDRELLEKDGVIPVIDTHPLFYCAANFNEDGSLYSLEFVWHRRGEIEDYSDLQITAGYQEIEQIEDYIFIELDENGNIVEPTVTVTERDGISIVAEGREDRNKTITFQNESGWYQIEGSWNDDYESMAMLLDWLWEHPVDFNRFSKEAGDEYVTCSLEEYPGAFAEYLPDFEAFGFMEETTILSLKNGVPVRLEAFYVAHVDEDLVKGGNYYDVEGYTTMHWCLETEPDVYDLEKSAGDIREMTEQMVTEILSKESSVSFTWDGYCVTVYPKQAQEAWALIESLQERL